MALKKVANTLDDILKEGWNHGPLGCLGDCSLDSVPCKTGTLMCTLRLAQRRTRDVRLVARWRPQQRARRQHPGANARSSAALQHSQQHCNM